MWKENLIVQYWKCPSDGTKIKSSAVCDRKPDCPNGDDEATKLCQGDSKKQDYLGILIATNVILGIFLYMIGS